MSQTLLLFAMGGCNYTCGLLCRIPSSVAPTNNTSKIAPPIIQIIVVSFDVLIAAGEPEFFVTTVTTVTVPAFCAVVTWSFR